MRWKLRLVFLSTTNYCQHRQHYGFRRELNATLSFYKVNYILKIIKISNIHENIELSNITHYFIKCFLRLLMLCTLCSETLLNQGSAYIQLHCGWTVAEWAPMKPGHLHTFGALPLTLEIRNTSITSAIRLSASTHVSTETSRCRIISSAKSSSRSACWFTRSQPDDDCSSGAPRWDWQAVAWWALAWVEQFWQLQLAAHVERENWVAATY